jgi:hypothetical protein
MRPPEPGDVLYTLNGYSYVVGEVLGGNSAEGYRFRQPYRHELEVQIARPNWRYKGRADGGPVDIEGGE